MRRTIPQSEQDPKQAVMYPFDREIVKRAARAFDLSDYQEFHPLSFFRVLRRLRADRALGRLPQVLAFERFAPTPTPAPDIAVGLPKEYVAVSLAFTGALPGNERNRRFLDELLAQIAAQDEVVLVDRQDSLERQTRAIARARAFVGGFGDFAVLAAFCGVPALTFHSEDLPPEPLGVLRAASERSGWSLPSIERVERFERLRLPARMTA